MPSPPPGRRPTRRTLLRVGVGGAGLAASAVLAGCTPARTPDPTAEATESPLDTTTHAGKTLLAYFSRAGENWWNGGRRNLETGNTEILARMIAERTGCDLYRIEATDAYPAGYDETVARNVREQDTDARPDIAQPLPDFGAYDKLVLASPIWNVRPPMIMNTFLDGIDPAGKTILPAVTYAVSGLGDTLDVYTSAAPTADIGAGLALRGETVPDSTARIRDWLNDVGLD